MILNASVQARAGASQADETDRGLAFTSDMGAGEWERPIPSVANAFERSIRLPRKAFAPLRQKTYTQDQTEILSETAEWDLSLMVAQSKRLPRLARRANVVRRIRYLANTMS